MRRSFLRINKEHTHAILVECFRAFGTIVTNIWSSANVRWWTSFMHLHFNDLQIEGAAWQWRTHYISTKYWQNVGKLQIIVCEPFEKKSIFIWYFTNTAFVVILIHRLNTESKLIIIYALLIVCGFNLLETNSNAREPLLTLARHLKSTSNVTDGWGEGLLGAIGLKKETTSNRYEMENDSNASY